MARFHIDRRRSLAALTLALRDLGISQPENIAASILQAAIIEMDSVCSPTPAGDGEQTGPLIFSPAEKTRQMSEVCHPVSTALPYVYDAPSEARDTLREVSSTARAGVRETSDAAQKILKEQADESRFVGSEFAAAQKDRADQDRYLSAAFERAQKDRTDDARWNGNHGSHDHNDRHGGTRWEADQFSHVQHDILRAEGRLVDSDRRTELAVEKTSAGTQVAIERTAAATNLAVEKTAAATNLSIERIGAATNLAIEKTAAATNLAIQVSNAAIMLDASKNAAAAALALEKCCCEIRTAVAAEGTHTRELVSQVDRERLQARLATLEGKLLNLSSV
jgi:hypothetical protein